MSSNRCPNCDYDELEPDEVECPACGYNLTRPNYVWIWLGIGAVVALIIAAVFWAIPSSGKPAQAPVQAAAPPAAPGVGRT